MELLSEIVKAQHKVREGTGFYDLKGRHWEVFNMLPIDTQNLWTLEVMLLVNELSTNILDIQALIIATGKGYLIAPPPPIDEDLYWRLVLEAKAQKALEDEKHEPGPKRRTVPV